MQTVLCVCAAMCRTLKAAGQWSIFCTCCLACLVSFGRACKGSRRSAGQTPPRDGLWRSVAGIAAWDPRAQGTLGPPRLCPCVCTLVPLCTRRRELIKYLGKRLKACLLTLSDFVGVQEIKSEKEWCLPSLLSGEILSLFTTT